MSCYFILATACKTGQVCPALTKIPRKLCVDQHNAITRSGIDPATLRRSNIVNDLRVISLNVCWRRRGSHILVHLSAQESL